MNNVFKIREGAGLPSFSKEIYLVYWIKLVYKSSISYNIVSNKLGESVYKPMNKAEIIAYLKVSESTWYRFMTECKSNKSLILYKNYIYINPRFNFNVWNFNKITFQVFKEYDPLFLPFIENYNILIKEELYELLSTPDVEVKANTISPELYILKSKEKHIERFEYNNTKYAGMKDIIKLRCVKHNQEFETIAENHLNGLGGCPLCHKEHLAYTYYDLPTYFYIIQIGHLYKVGITTGSIKRRYASEKVEYKVLVNILLNSGAQAFKLEQWCKDTFKDYKYVGESPFKLTGITEIFNIDVSAQPEFILHLNKIKDSND